METTVPQVPGLKEKHSSHKVGVGKAFTSDLPAELTSLKSLLSSVVTEIGSLHDQRKLLEVKMSRLDSQLQEKESEQEGATAAKEQLEQAVEETHKKWRKELEEMEAEKQLKLEQSWQLQEELRREKKKLVEERDSLQEQLTKIEQINTTMSRERDDLETRIAAKNALLDQAQRQVASLLAQRTCAVAQLAVVQDLVRGVEAQNTDEHLVTIAEKSAKIDQLTNQIRAMTLEREEYQRQIQSLSEKHRFTLQELQRCAEENRSRNFETEKIKMQLMTDIRILRSKVSQLEEEKSSMELKLSSAAGPGSAFQPVQGPQPSAQGSGRKVSFNPVQEKSQQQITELQHKVSEEGEGYEIAHLSDQEQDTGAPGVVVLTCRLGS